MALTAQTNSRIADSSRSWQATCNTDVTGWTKTNEFILSTWAYADSVNPSSDCKLQWRRAGGTFVDVAADTEICWGTNTVLVNDALLLVDNTAGCFVDWDYGKENEGDNLAYLLNIANGNYGEVQWALGFGSGAQDSQEYEIQFVVIDFSSNAVCQASITTVTSGNVYNESGSDTVEFSDTAVANVTVNIGTFYMIDHWYDYSPFQWFDNNDDQWLPRDRYDPRYKDGLILSDVSSAGELKILYTITTKSKDYYFVTKNNSVC